MVCLMSSLLYEEIEIAYDFVDKPKVPNCITQNIKQPLREYQENALSNFIFYMNSKKHKSVPSKHLLFHMATGSGKTNIIASSILYLYELGYRDFIFFVNTNNIITKTQENLLNKQSAKYLFKNKIMIKNREVNINVIDDTFDESRQESINILFTTINKLHGDLETTVKENSITYGDFKEKKLVLIADEAHHLNAGTKKEKEGEQNWEQTTKNLLNINEKNILLEFTATQDLADKKIADKYRDKIIYDYPLKKFRDDKYSKDIRLISDNLNTNERILQTLMISEYRKIIAQNELNLSMKPVIMFKTVKTTDKIDAIFIAFIKMIEELKTQDINNIFKKSSLEVLAKLEHIIDDKQSFVNTIKYAFSKQNCLVIHSKVKNKEEKLKYLNSLEDIHNPIRAIFAVDILNEGWDVLNLFDIVKLDEAKTTPKSTISEAQLIGRGARYFPFEHEMSDKYKRKFDKYPDESIKILEELYFHSINQSEYINAITKELRKIGLLDTSNDEYKTIELKVKQSFLDDELYKNGVIYVNEQVKQDRKTICGISDYVSSYKTQKRYVDNRSREIIIYDEEMEDVVFTKVKKFRIKNIDPSLVRVAINKKEFFYFSSLKKYFVNLKSISEFIRDSAYLGSVELTIHSTDILVLSDEVKIYYTLEILETIEKNILKNATTMVGSHSFKPVRINSKIPALKKLKLKESDSPIHRVEEWYIFEPHGGTSEEMNFVEFIKANINELQSLYDDVKLIRNEKAFDIFSFDKRRDGAKFEPDFILMLKEKNGCYHQIFCEPKGEHLLEVDKWKNEFLSDITKCTNAKSLILKDINEDGLTLYENSCYKVFGLPFYNYSQEHEFKREFKELIL